MPSGRTPAKTAKSCGRTLPGIGPGGQTVPSSPTARATIAAVAGASPVTITVRTPNVRSSATSAADSARGGSLSAMSPASLSADGGPTATARTLKPCDSSSFAAVEAVGEGWVRPTTTAKAPFTIRSLPPLGSTAVASDIFVAGSNGTNVVRFGRSEGLLPAAAERMAASTASCPPCELASAANASTWASSKPGSGRTVVTFSSLRVSVPVLSAHRTSMDAASSTAERRVGRTPWRARDRAPTAAARVKVAGSATGIEARTAVSTREMISASGMA